MSSEKNSFGLGSGSWFDGDVSCHYGLMTGDLIKITQVNEYRNIQPCSEDSYYECLEKRFTTQSEKRVVNESVFSSNPKCSPFSLPENQVPVCKEDNDKIVYNKAILDLKSDQINHCKKSCHMKEFKTSIGSLRERVTVNKSWREWLFDNWIWNNHSYSMVFEIHFEL